MKPSKLRNTEPILGWVLQRGYVMRFLRGLLLGSAAATVGAAGVQAADLPTRKSAPVEYVRICDAYGAGFFYIPGTDTCLKVGGLVVADLRMSNPSYSFTPGIMNGTTMASRGTLGTTTYAARSRDTYGYAALGRIELDARTATAWGTLRSFIRADAYYGSSQIASTGSGAQGISGATVLNTTQNTSVARYTVILNKAFIQFAGLTAGYAQSFFDFYADAYNLEGLKGSNGTTAMLAYTATFGGGFSATISAEDQASRRTNVGTTIVGDTATPAGARIPDIVANFRVDQPWGAVQASGVAHRVDTTLYTATAAAVPATCVGGACFPAASQNQYGFAAQLGFQYNMDMIAPGDKLWLQAAYENGALSFVDGSNLAFTTGAPNFDRAPGNVTPSYGQYWNHAQDYDCVWTGSSCEKQSGYAIVAAFKHYWMPTLSSAVYGSFLRINYSTNAINGANFLTAGGVGNGALSYQEARIGTNLFWTPVKGFDIGGEVMFIHQQQLTSVNPFPVTPAGIPSFTGTGNIFEGRLRVQRAF